MSEQERIELLKEVARVAPKEWQANLRDHEHLTLWAVDTQPKGYACHLNFDEPDSINGTAIIAMLDAMEKAGFEIHIATVSTGEGIVGYNVSASKFCILGSGVECTGTTRAEAVARAFVQVFKQ